MKKILLFLLLPALLFSSGVRDPLAAPYGKNSDELTINDMLLALRSLYSFIDRNFIFDIDKDEMFESLVSAMLTSLNDPYSFYVPYSESDEYLETSTGKYVGIGVYLRKADPSIANMNDKDSWMIKIESPFPGSPAERAGLRSGDYISEINGESVFSLSSYEAAKLVRGHEGEPLTLKIHRGSAVFDITIVPEVVDIPSLLYDIIEDDVGYIAIMQFAISTAADMKEALEDLLSRGASSFIIDLRNNGGGVVLSAMQIADFFLSSGPIITTKYKNSSDDVTVQASSDTIVSDDFPIVLIVNEGSASSSEILTAALKDSKRATVVGNKTYGKGIIQEMRSFSDGYFQLTVGSFYSPLGNVIHGIGIEPDIYVESPTYTDEELESFASLYSSGEASSFVDENPSYTEENIALFKSLHEGELPDSLLTLLIRTEYVYRMDYDERPVADPVYDEALKEALKVLGK